MIMWSMPSLKKKRTRRGKFKMKSKKLKELLEKFDRYVHDKWERELEETLYQEAVQEEEEESQENKRIENLLNDKYTRMNNDDELKHLDDLETENLLSINTFTENDKYFLALANLEGIKEYSKARGTNLSSFYAKIALKLAKEKEREKRNKLLEENGEVEKIYQDLIDHCKNQTDYFPQYRNK